MSDFATALGPRDILNLLLCGGSPGKSEGAGMERRFPGEGLADETSLRGRGAPGLGGNAAERDAGVPHKAAVEKNSYRGRHGGKRIRLAVAHLLIGRGSTERSNRDADGRSTRRAPTPFRGGGIAGEAVQVEIGMVRSPRGLLASTWRRTRQGRRQNPLDTWRCTSRFPPKMACPRFSPASAAHPLPGERLLQGYAYAEIFTARPLEQVAAEASPCCAAAATRHLQ